MSALELPDDAVEDPDALYDWCALARAVWSATYPLARRVDARHRRRLIRFLARESASDDVAELARELVAALGADVPEVQQPVDVRLSRRMATALRHTPPEKFSMNPAGWTSLIDLSNHLQVSVERVLQVATHPEEPRFEVKGGQIRANYGHSRPIDYGDREEVELPETVFHGTPWATLSLIAANGIKPMGRNLVHLATNEREALEVARRKAPPVLLRVAANQCPRIIRLAPGVWGARHVPPKAPSIQETVHELLPLDYFA